jgi:hypothetical protein
MKSTKGKKPRARSRAPSGARRLADDCTIPPPIAAADLPRLVLPRDDDEVRKIAEYVEWQAKGETVEHAEKVSTEHVMGRKHECWDVRTDKERYWVITSPTNLYSQKLMPSLDYTLSFHIGIGARMASAKPVEVSTFEQIVMADAWRRWEQAGELLNEAEEAEDLQAVGMRCRECLIVMVRTISQPQMVPEGSTAPNHADVKHWCELIANHVAKGSSAKEVRGYLKATSKSGWELVSWLVHAQNATRADAMLVHDVTQHILAIFGTAMFRHRQGIPDRCGACGSYRISLWADEPGVPMKPRCEACGWVKDDR